MFLKEKKELVYNEQLFRAFKGISFKLSIFYHYLFLHCKILLFQVLNNMSTEDPKPARVILIYKDKT